MTMIDSEASDSVLEKYGLMHAPASYNETYTTLGGLDSLHSWVNNSGKLPPAVIMTLNHMIENIDQEWKAKTIKAFKNSEEVGRQKLTEEIKNGECDFAVERPKDYDGKYWHVGDYVDRNNVFCDTPCQVDGFILGGQGYDNNHWRLTSTGYGSALDADDFVHHKLTPRERLEKLQNYLCANGEDGEIIEELLSIIHQMVTEEEEDNE